jgi:hypothetical protein
MRFSFIAFPIKLATTDFTGFLCDIHACSCFLGAATKYFISGTYYLSEPEIRTAVETIVRNMEMGTPAVT